MLHKKKKQIKNISNTLLIKVKCIVIGNEFVWKNYNIGLLEQWFRSKTQKNFASEKLYRYK